MPFGIRRPRAVRSNGFYIVCGYRLRDTPPLSRLCVAYGGSEPFGRTALHCVRLSLARYAACPCVRAYAFRHTPRMSRLCLSAYGACIARLSAMPLRLACLGEWHRLKKGIVPHKINVGSPPPPPPPEDQASGAPRAGRRFLQSAQRCLYVP